MPRNNRESALNHHEQQLINTSLTKPYAVKDTRKSTYGVLKRGDLIT